MLELEWFFGNEVRIMIEIFIGVVSGIIGGLGMGGGTILILLLSLFFRCGTACCTIYKCYIFYSYCNCKYNCKFEK